MFKIEETASDEGDIKGAIFMRPDGMFEGRKYRELRARKCENGLDGHSEFEICAVTGTLIQARTLVHEQLGCNGDVCNHCRSV